MLKIAGQWVEQELCSACGDGRQMLAVVGVTGDNGLTAITAFLVSTPNQEESARRKLASAIAGLHGHTAVLDALHWTQTLQLTTTGKLQRARLGELSEQ